MLQNSDQVPLKNITKSKTANPKGKKTRKIRNLSEWKKKKKANNPDWNEALYTGTERSRNTFFPTSENFIKEEKLRVGHTQPSCCSEKFSVQSSIEELPQECKCKCLCFYNT